MKLIIACLSLYSVLLTASTPQVTTGQDAVLRAAIQKSLPLLQAVDETFLKKSQCVSCHHNSLTAVTVAAAREGGVAVNEEVARRQRSETAAYAESWRGRLLQGVPIPGASDAVSYMLLGLGTEKHPADPATDAMSSFLMEMQAPDGRWRIQARRPPLESSDFTVTATSLRALQLYPSRTDPQASRNAIQSAMNWLAFARATSTEERVFQLLALAWTSAVRARIAQAAQSLVAEQLPDGGWSQLLHMQSDAYATGEALVALQEGAALPAGNRSIKRGLQFLLDTQLEDGSWHVKTRSTPIQPYLESGFPHGRDQWISAAATNWATKALLLALKQQ